MPDICIICSDPNICKELMKENRCNDSYINVDLALEARPYESYILNSIQTTDIEKLRSQRPESTIGSHLYWIIPPRYSVEELSLTERRNLVNAVRVYKCIATAAAALGISKRTLSGKLRSYGYPAYWKGGN